MPFSSSTFDEVLTEHLVKINPNSVLDVGAGAGKHGKMVRELCPQARIGGVEPTKVYIDEYKLKEVYDELYEMDLMSYCDKQASERHDVVIFGDVLEHFFRSQAIDYLDYFLYRAQWVIAIWPSQMPQDAWEGNGYEIHKNNFSLLDLASRFDVQYYKKVFGWFHWNDSEMTHCWYNYAVMRGYVVKRNVSL
jgi:hypothetical protein